jgi:orotidine-5'-phosphate decarboxylase
MADLILALDVTDRQKAIDIARSCSPHIDAIKIGYPLVLSCGLRVAEDIAKADLPLIADFKVADIPNTNRLIAEQVFAAGFSGIICQGFTGRDSIAACVEAADTAGGDCYVVAEMSHPGSTDFFDPSTAERIAALAAECGADGIIAPATRPERVKKLRDLIGPLRILSPGVGAQGGDGDAVARIADRIIVGRAIYEAADPAAAAQGYGRIRTIKRG